MSKQPTNGRLNIVNRDAFPTFKPSPKDAYPVTCRIKSVRFKRFSMDEKHDELAKKNQAIEISSSEIYDNNKRKPNNGIFSPLFGADSSQDAPIFACACKKLTGGANLGRICPNCGQEVRTIEADLRHMGFIDIAPYHILSFHGWNAMLKVLKKDMMEAIIHTTRSINRAGNTKKSDIPTIMDLYEDYDEKYAELTGIPKNIAFMSKIPVYSSRLRPLMEQGNYHITMLEPNQIYLDCVNLAAVVKTRKYMPTVDAELEIQRNLNELQKQFNRLCEIIIDLLNGKNGAFRRSLASGRLDNTSRLVITLGTDLKADEVDVPYQLMMVQYEGEIANYLSRIQNIEISKAISLVQENQMVPHPIFVKIIKQLLKHGNGVWVLVNRNPTISESGIQYARIRKIHDDPTDMTLHLPPDVLALLGADFWENNSTDPVGVRLGVIPLKNKSVNV